MDDYYRRNHVPAFGSWDWNNDLPFTQCLNRLGKPDSFVIATPRIVIYTSLAIFMRTMSSLPP
ncbi:hypothetical protein F3Y22_tig00006666pilonHSYRG00056 [Hibiscus syriacus]|uniref:Uncharacterized protein n=1 Tax=Hibiscus syriacus TaxID=106335 RepID=A0A6A3CFS1_HIBSY|nr:hypothetical protein F3Y22_tig00006666pilonHSYRG00056 [Hibiscus syriacus]